MALPLIGAVAAFIARQGIKAAIKKFGKKAVQQATKAETAKKTPPKPKQSQKQSQKDQISIFFCMTFGMMTSENFPT